MVQPCNFGRVERTTEVNGRSQVRDWLTGDYFLGLAVNERNGSLKVVQRSSPLWTFPVGERWPNLGAECWLALTNEGNLGGSGSLQLSMHVLLLLLAEYLIAGSIVAQSGSWTWMWLIRLDCGRGQHVGRTWVHQRQNSPCAARVRSYTKRCLLRRRRRRNVCRTCQGRRWVGCGIQEGRQWIVRRVVVGGEGVGSWS
jgi:hypothetical protein